MRNFNAFQHTSETILQTGRMINFLTEPGPMNKKQIIRSVIVVFTFLVAIYGNRIITGYFNISIESIYLRVAYFYAWWVLPTILVTGLLYGFGNIFKTLGLQKGFFTGLVFALITVSPMLISSAVTGQIDENPDVFLLLRSTLFAGFAEELFYRGFLFGILFRKLGWGFIPASVIGALFFGLAHIYQGTSLPETAGIFLITAIGAAWFAWLYVEWDNNLWVPVFLHILMNLSWTLFDISTNALGGWYSNLFRAITIALTIIITLRYHKKTGLKINRTNLLVNTNN
jgi:membrane protease YdiL (CAAX protease family)